MAVEIPKLKVRIEYEDKSGYSFDTEIKFSTVSSTKNNADDVVAAVNEIMKRGHRF